MGDWILGTSYLTLGAMFIAVNLTVIYLTTTNKSAYSNITFTYMVQMAIGDIVVLLTIAIYAGLLVTFEESVKQEIAERVFAWSCALGANCNAC